MFEGETLALLSSLGCGTATHAAKIMITCAEFIVRPTPITATMPSTASRNWKGGGRASARETIGRVAAGAIAKKILAREFGVEIVGYVKQVWQLHADVDPSSVTQEDVESNIARCPDQDMAVQIIERIKEARKDGDSLGGVVECVARGVPVGLGEPVFDKLEADLAKSVLSMPACKGFEVGSGFAARHSQAHSITIPSTARAVESARAPTIPEESKAVSATGRTSSFEPRSNPPRRSCVNRIR